MPSSARICIIEIFHKSAAFSANAGLFFVGLIFLTGCSGSLLSTPPDAPVQTSSIRGLKDPMRDGTLTEQARASATRQSSTPSGRLAERALNLIRSRRYKEASAKLNRALKMDIRSSYIQFLNGLAYHLRARQGEAKNYKLAEQGYQVARNFDKANWLTSFYLGHLYMAQKKYAQAQDAFAEAAYLRPRNKDVLFQLAAASYYAGDPLSADALLQRVEKLGVDKQAQPDLLQALVVTSAAVDRPGQAYKYLSDYQSIARDTSRVTYLKNRVDDWKKFYKTAQFTDNDSAEMNAPVPNDFNNSDDRPNLRADPGFGSTVTGPVDRAGDNLNSFKNEGMVVVDVAIIGTEEDITDSAGLNLLSGLRIQFGDPFNGLASIGLQDQKVKDFVDPDGNSYTRAITRAISIPAISYSLNIANSDSSRNEILAKPSLVALNGETSEFFSGVDVNAAAVSGAAGDSVRIEKEIGVRLRVSPEILPNDMVKLNVTAERTFLTQPSQSVVFQFRLDTSKTTVNANVAMKFGETLILSGLSEKENENNKDGVPGIQDVPVLQYFFARSEKRRFNKSVLILLTPHRPKYMNRSPADEQHRLGKLSRRERAIERLANRHRDWFRPNTNLRSVFQHMRTNRLYEEFRNGDFPIEDWTAGRTHNAGLRTSMNWLHF